jgi:hypothetical protein
LGLLAFAHVPFVVVYFISLSRHEYYQFYPFATVAFVWLYANRFDRGIIHLGWIGRAAILLDMIVLTFAAATNWVQSVMPVVDLYCYVVRVDRANANIRSR